MNVRTEVAISGAGPAGLLPAELRHGADAARAAGLPLAYSNRENR
jgi:hypothetical protein